MPLSLRRTLLIALAIGGTLMALLFAWRVSEVDVVPKPATVAACGLVRAEVIAIVMPGHQLPKATQQHIAAQRCSYADARAEIRLEIWYQREGQNDTYPAIENAQFWVQQSECQKCRVVRTPQVMGDESYEFTDSREGIQAAEVKVRMGTLIVGARFAGRYATEEALLAATRLIAQEAAASCAAKC